MPRSHQRLFLLALLCVCLGSVQIRLSKISPRPFTLPIVSKVCQALFLFFLLSWPSLTQTYTPYWTIMSVCLHQRWHVSLVYTKTSTKIFVTLQRFLPVCCRLQFFSVCCFSYLYMFNSNLKIKSRKKSTLVSKFWQTWTKNSFSFLVCS